MYIYIFICLIFVCMYLCMLTWFYWGLSLLCAISWTLYHFVFCILCLSHITCRSTNYIQKLVSSVNLFQTTHTKMHIRENVPIIWNGDGGAMQIAYHYFAIFCIIMISYIYTHCVRKKVNHCIHFHNSGKQCRILAKFCHNNATSNCKQIAKFP